MAPHHQDRRIRSPTRWACRYARRRSAEDIDGDDNVGTAVKPIERQGIGRAAVDHDAALDRHRPEQPGNRDRGGDGGRSGPDEKAASCRRCRSVAITVSGISSAEKSSGTCVRKKLRAKFLGVHLGRLAEGTSEQVGQLAGARLHQPAPYLARDRARGR